MVISINGLMPVVYQVAGYGLITVVVTTVLEKLGQPTIAKLVHIAAWAGLGIYAINIAYDHMRAVGAIWGVS